MRDWRSNPFAKRGLARPFAAITLADAPPLSLRFLQRQGGEFDSL